MSGDPEPRVAAYWADSYPHNHNYRATARGLVATRQLARRFRRIARLYPDPLVSLLDVSCSKGFFVLAAAERPTCERAVGIDIDAAELEACEAAKTYVGATRGAFRQLRLDELVERLAEFGGPFETVLVINCYQYLYFGSERSPDCYLDHREIFRLFAALTSKRVIFSNRTELEDLQGFPRQVAESTGHAASYTTARVEAAASEFFDLRPQGHLGRLPLLTLERR